MGCVSSKQTVSVTPAIDHSGVFKNNNACSGSGRIVVEEPSPAVEKKLVSWRSKSGKKSSSKKSGSELGTESGRASSNCRSESLSFRLGNLSKYLEAEQVAAGWPSWLSNVAGEAIHGWVPFRSDAFEKLEKIGQGTYSSVFRARETETGMIVALKKVKFDNFEPESVRFMAREILILRRLDHPNVIKLQGLVASNLSCNIHLVFEYVEHDLTGLLSSPDVSFTTPQIKCYMKQLLSGLDHCHARGVMHRDIKGSNLLVNNEGVLKVADFGLANFCNASGNNKQQPLTSRVVTLWYRPPELLLGATEYGASVDLWSVGCVFAELLLKKPVLQGRTEVEQLHKIFKLCGSPPADYWKKLSPGIEELVKKLRANKIDVYLISGGFRQMINPVASILGIPRENIFANNLLFGNSGEFVGFDEKEPTSRSGGKAKAVQHIRKGGSYKTMVMIGDGATDLEARRPGGADLFICYAGVQLREAVAEQADWLIFNFEPLINSLD
ncbi:hypothetical protein DY000_02055062 [Brassica cretica]|uniref:Protein kinase domain-containing protein n=1 Tax=Brassica cretica TaxID=69181 RepID=A0ABQ7A5X9_BRACR|nr:hypothetical protein DY000_02055062 [Brassica cretica]